MQQETWSLELGMYARQGFTIYIFAQLQDNIGEHMPGLNPGLDIQREQMLVFSVPRVSLQICTDDYSQLFEYLGLLKGVFMLVIAGKKAKHSRFRKYQQQKQSKQYFTIIIYPIISFNANSATAQPQNHEDNQFVKYVWNKKTKRLERRDMRTTTNFEKIDKKKFENFSKVNQKSKILCMQLQENYFNQTLLPAAIVGEGDVNFKEIQEETIYGPNDLKKNSPLPTLNSPVMMKPRLEIAEGNILAQLPTYQKQMLMMNTTTNNTTKTNFNTTQTTLMSKRRRASAAETEHFHSKSRERPDKNQGANQAETKEQMVDKKLQIIRMALRGDAPMPNNDQRGPIEDYLSEATTENDFRSTAAAAAALYYKNQAFFNQQAAQHYLNTGIPPASMGSSGGFALPTQRPQSLLETRDLFMRTKLHAMQQTNKKLILSQREQLKTSMMNHTNYSALGGFYNPLQEQQIDLVLPQLEATQARLYRHPANLMKAAQAAQVQLMQMAQGGSSSGRSKNRGMSGQMNSSTPSKSNTGGNTNPNHTSSGFHNPNLGNISVRLKINNNTQRPFHSNKSVTKGGDQSSPRSSNNNLDIIEYGVPLKLNKEQLKRNYPDAQQEANEGLKGLANSDTMKEASSVQQHNNSAEDNDSIHGDQVIISGGESKLIQDKQSSIQQSSVTQQEPSQQQTNLEIAPIQQAKHIHPLISPLNLKALNKGNRESIESAVQEQVTVMNLERQKNRTQPYQNPISSVDQANINRFRLTQQMGGIKVSRSPFDTRQLQFNNNNQLSEESVNDPLLMSDVRLRGGVPKNVRGATSNSGGDFIQGMYSSKYATGVNNMMNQSVMSNNSSSLGKQKAIINQLPMQDFHLEQWRNAYKNINSATRHFYTGSSFPAVAKI